MHPIDFIESWYYGTYYNILFLILSWFTVLYYIGSNGQKMLHSQGSPMQGVALLLTMVIIVYLGLRPDGPAFVDSAGYRNTYIYYMKEYVPINFSREWLWPNINCFCKNMGLNPYEFFLVVEFGYIGGMFVACFLLMRSNLWMSVLFFYISFSCYSFGVNGIRNGLACSIELVAVAILALDTKRWPAAAILMFLALGVHRSTMLPSAAALASAFVLKDTKNVLRFWVLSIFISLAVGPMVQHFFASLGFDDRMSVYGGAGSEEVSSKSGFRFDFLFYSLWPVVLVWYVTKYRHFKDKTFNIIANTYVLCNAFWIMVIRAAYSNRFAYLSWFIYPLVFAYPLLRMNLWKDQDRKTAIIYFLYSGFSFFMFFIYYFGTMSGFRGFNLYWWK